MKEKTYKSLSEVSKLLNLNTHIIRYWDSKLGISSQSNSKKKKFFNNHNINQLRKLKSTLYQNGKYNYSIELANKIINRTSKRTIINETTIPITNNKNIINSLKKINNNLKKILSSF